QAFALPPDVGLHCEEHSGVGTLTLQGPEGRQGYWRYTLSRAPAANRLARRLAALREGPANGDEVVSVCPSCGAPITAENGQCPACAPRAAQPRFSSLLRLVGVARPHLRLVVLGFLCSLAGTAASLVPPYLTMPLLDRVLVPYQNGQEVNFLLVPWYLS